MSLAFRAPHQVSGDPLADLPAEVPERRSIWSFLDRPSPMVLAIIGAPGSGKTTLLRHTARQVCKSRRRRRNLPVLLHLRDHATSIVAAPQTGLAEVVRGTLGAFADEEPPGWFEQQLRHGQCLVLLDGLDEVARQEDRRRVVDWVERQVKWYPGNDYVITSRPHGYHTAPLDAATVLQVRGFTDQQVTRFLHGWYFAVERHSTSVADEGVRHRAQLAADDLLQRLSDTPVLYDLTVNPLLLTMIANVHRYRGALPGSRADLYAEICQVLLWRRQEAKKLSAELRGDQKEVVLREVAFTMMQRRVHDRARADMLQIIGSVLPRVSLTLTAEEFLSDAASSGLLIERENGIYTFSHQTFQEYLAASYIREKGKSSILIEAVGDPWWREVTLLYVARADAGPIVEACLARGTVSALALAFDCADQASELAPQTRTVLDGMLADVGDEAIDPEHRRLMAGVTVMRYLRDRTRVTSGGQLCLRPITIGIYKLFLQDVQARGEKRSLDCPDPIDPGAMGEIAMGMRGSDALAFVAWLNELTGGELVYRLPTREEIDDLAARRMPGALGPGIWLAPRSHRNLPELWTASGIDHPHALDGQTLRQHLNTDIKKPPLLVALLLIRSHALIRALARDFDLAHVVDRALDRARDRDLALDRALDLASALARDLALARARALALARDRARARDRSFLDRALDGALDTILVTVVGTALSRSLSAATLAYQVTSRGAPSSANFLAQFSSHLAEEAGIKTAIYIVSLDALADQVRTALEAFRRLRDQSPQHSAGQWAVAVARWLEDTAVPMFTRQQRLGFDAAAAIRLAALCLAGEASDIPSDEVDLKAKFQEIAAGITLLERRLSGQTPPTETIIVALA